MTDYMVCPLCGDDDIRIGTSMGSKTYEKEGCYREFKRAYCRSCGAKLVHVTTFRKVPDAAVLIPRESMKAEYGMGWGRTSGRWA